MAGGKHHEDKHGSPQTWIGKKRASYSRHTDKKCGNAH